MTTDIKLTDDSWSSKQNSLKFYSPMEEGTLGLGIGSEHFGSILYLEDLRFIRGFFFIPTEFNVELAKLRERIHHPPSS